MKPHQPGLAPTRSQSRADAAAAARHGVEELACIRTEAEEEGQQQRHFLHPLPCAKDDGVAPVAPTIYLAPSSAPCPTEK
jgi:hypothetical protein